MKHGFSVAVLRSLIVGVLSLPLASNLLFGSIVSAHASEATLPTSATTNPVLGPIIISEVNWAGSPVSSLDQWIELYNTSDNAIDFAANSYSLYSASTDIADLKNGVVPAHGFYLVSRQDQNHTSLQINPDYIAPNFNLPSAAAQISVKDKSGQVIDQAGDGVSNYAAGSDAIASDHVSKSMYRLDVSQSGIAASNWASSHTAGGGLKANVDPLAVDSKGQPLRQWATPAGAASSQAIDRLHPNPELAEPKNVVYQVAVAADKNSTISGQLVTYPGEVSLTSVTLTFQRLDAVGMVQFTTAVDAQGNFSFNPTHDQLPVGLYRVVVTGKDNQSGSQLAAITVMSSDASSPQNVYTAGSTTPAAMNIQAPVLDPYAAAINTPSITLTGTVQGGVAVVISINGQNIAQQSLQGKNSFSLPVTLEANTRNVIEVRARDAAGNTGPAAVATVVHSNMAPLLQMNNVNIVGSTSSTQEDKLTGLAGAAVKAAKVYVYAEADLSDLKPYVASVMSDGSFGPIPVGFHLHPVLYVVAVDAAGNRSRSLTVTNSLHFSTTTQVQSLAFSALSQNGLTVQWSPVPGAVNYQIRYKVNGGTYSSPIEVCMGTMCPTQKTLVNLQNNADYVISVTPIDAFGAMGVATEIPFHTLSTDVVGTASSSANVTTPAVLTPIPTPPSSGTVSQTLPTPTQTTAPSSNITPTPAPSPTESGDVKSADTQTTARNLTPWIILVSLIALAVIATLAYFYWFGRDEELQMMDNAAATSAAKKEETAKSVDSTPSVKSDTGDATKKEAKPKSSSDETPREKRW